MVLLRADTGVGKTRLIQDFYRWLVAETDAGGYWPAELPDTGKSMAIVPQMADRKLKDTPELPWMWSAVRCRDPGERNSDARGDVAFDVIGRQFRAHLYSLHQAQVRRGANKALAKATLSTLASLAVPGSGQVVEIVQQATAGGITGWDQLQLLLRRVALRDEPDASATELAVRHEQQTLLDASLKAFSALGNRREKAAPTVPMILIVDDAHWADSVTLAVVGRLLSAARDERWPILVLMSAWDETLTVQESGPEPTGLAALLADSPIEPDIRGLEPLADRRMERLVLDRLPRLLPEAVDLLVRRSSGNLDLLFDFVDELAEAPGWTDSEGRLLVDLEEVEHLPSNAAAMARRRLRTIGSEVAETLALASVQGMEFHGELLARVAARLDLDMAVNELLVDSDDRHGLTETREHPALKLAGEFRRHVYWEVSAEVVARRGGWRADVEQALAATIAELRGSSEWKQLGRRERGILGQRLLELIEEHRLQGSEWGPLAADLRLDLATRRLDLGDVASGERFATTVLETEERASTRARAYELLVQAAYMAGDVERERSRLRAWRADGGDGVAWHLRAAAVSMRVGETTKAIEHARQAVERPDGRAVEAATTLSGALWAAGRPAEALSALSSLPDGAAPEAPGQVDIDHSASLVLHDLERNLRVVDHARRCVAAYRADGRVEQEIIAMVNHGDALWGAGDYRAARTELEQAYEAAGDARLPHALDIASLCLANVLAVTGDLDRAKALSVAGIELAERIGHGWDAIYGRVHGHLIDVDMGTAVDPQSLIELAGSAEACGYDYLWSLAISHAALVAFIQGDDSRVESVLAESAAPGGRALSVGPAATLAGIAVLVDRTGNAEVARAFLRALGRCEGLKGRPGIALRALDRLRTEGRLDAVSGEFAARWEARFAPTMERRASTVRLRECDYRACEARCCYDGVYLEPGDEARIQRALELDRGLAERLPEAYIVAGSWNTTTGRKTAVRPHEYAGPDFPEHFTKTRCVFAESDGACGLQRVAVARGEHPWTYKPQGCWIHPVRVSGDGNGPPPGLFDRDDQYWNADYPGYVSHTPCGQDRSDGKPWTEAMAEELEQLGRRRRP